MRRVRYLLEAVHGALLFRVVDANVDGLILDGKPRQVLHLNNKHKIKQHVRVQSSNVNMILCLTRRFAQEGKIEQVKRSGQRCKLIDCSLHVV